MRIINILDSQCWNSQSRTVLNLSRAFAAEGYECAVVARKQWEGAQLFSSCGVDARMVKMGGFWNLLAPSQIASMLPDKDSEPYIVHTHSLEGCRMAVRAIRLAKVRNARLVVTLHQLPGRINLAEKADLDMCSAIIVDSNVARQAIADMGYDASGRIYVVMPGSPILSLQTPLPCTLAPEKPLTFVYHGRMTHEKGVDLLVNAFIELQDLNVRLIMCGEGPGRDVMPLIRLLRSRKLSDRVEWLGAVDNVSDAIRRADVGVYASRNPQAFSLSMVECMAEGRPVISSNHEPRQEMLVDGRCGMLVDLYKPGCLAQAMRMLATDRQLLLKLSGNSRSHAISMFGFKKFHDTIIEIYRSVC